VNEEEKKLTAKLERPLRPAWRQLFKTTEGRIFLLGIAVALVGFIVMGVAASGSPQTVHMIGVMSFTNIVFGRAVAMSIAYAGGYDHALVVSVNMWVETVLVLLFYPLFVFSMRKLVVFTSMRRLLDRVQAAAEHHHDTVRRYGIVGLFVFVWFPFWMTGPVVGAAIGYLLAFPAWLTLLVVLVGTFIATLGWAWLLFGLYTRAAVFGAWAPALIVGTFILIVLVSYWLHRRGKG
jgi:uncharacterized membrane protein